ncbi:hypothetical protein KPH14_008810 [Odynerus spinipes]|uniref:Uncharacterized protein n=1 Tax=Odynerus spinipes TaxID=1348599 RepID=A0AAD9R9Q9_9HYME|nr:hypothetical protein KPH14_008810 [Odynerus spinipes]
MEDEDEWDKEEEEEEDEENRRTAKENRTYVLRRRYSERIRQKNTETRTKSELTFQCSITYSELDRENIPLAYLLNDRALRKARYSATPVVVNPLPKTPACNDAKRSTKKLDDPCESISDTMTTERATISSEKRSFKENEEREYSRNEKNNSSILETSESSSPWTSLSESSSSSFVAELPTKKLFLRRFMTTMNIEIEKMSQPRTMSMPLQERNSNVSAASQSKRLIKSCTHSFVSSSSSSSYAVLDKENIPNLERDLEEKVKVRLDSSIALPFVTKLHRDFLSSVDFDSL